MYYVYLVKCSDNTLYCGQTKNLKNRIKLHNTNNLKGAKYTRGRRPVKLVYYEKISTLQLALKREIEVKKMSKVQKENLIKRN